MAVPNLVPLLGSISGTLAGPQLAQRAAAALGIAGTPAGNLVAGASPSAIGAGIATLSAGAEVDEAMRQALNVSANDAGSLGQMGMAPQGMAPQMPQGMPPQMPQGMPPQMPQGMPPQGMPPQMPQGMPQQGVLPQGMPQQGVLPQIPQDVPPQGMGAQQPTMQNPFPQVQPPQSLGTGLGTLRPQQQQPQMGSIAQGLV